MKAKQAYIANNRMQIALADRASATRESGNVQSYRAISAGVGYSAVACLIWIKGRDAN